MIWGSDLNFEDYGIEEDGIVSNWTCPSCESFAEFYTKINVDK